MEVMLAAEVRTKLVIRNTSSAIASVLVTVTITSLDGAIVIVHRTLLFAVVIALLALLLVALLLFLRVHFGPPLAIVHTHVWVVITAILVVPRRPVFPRSPHSPYRDRSLPSRRHAGDWADR